MHTTTHPILTVAQHIAEEIATRADEADKAGKMPASDVQLLRDTGYLTLSVPQEYGGLGLSLHDCVQAHLQVAQGSASTAMFAGMTMHIFGDAREQRYWDDAVLERFSRAVSDDGAIFNSVASEPALGSPSRGRVFKTTATLTEDGEHWCINGHKTWTTGGKHLTHMLVSLSVGDGTGQILVPNHVSGVEWEETWSDSLSLRASDSHDVHFKDVIVPRENLIEKTGGKPGPNVWFPMVMSAVYLGAAMAARNATIRFALERVPTALGKPIATLPKIQRQIGEMDMLLQATQALFLEVAGEWTGNNEDRATFLPRVASAKTMVNRTANRVTDMALQIAGGTSITKDLPLERYFRDVRAGSMQPPSGDTALEMIGRAAIEG
jgi:alkylation response protein AidB-like acyl-CoA dehydrogenase